MGQEAVNVVKNEVKVPDNSLGNSTIQGAMSTVLLVAAGLSLVFIAIGGLRYVYSQGNPQQTERAKETIIYAIVGLIISISAFAIVEFVYSRIR